MNTKVQLLLQQAIQSFHGGNFDSADLMLNQIIKVDAKNFQVLHLLGLTKALKSEYIEAVNYLSKAARIQPNDAGVHYNLAKAFADSGEEDKAIIHYGKALTIKKDFAEAWSNKAALLNNLKRYDEAIIHLDNALGLKNDIAETWFNKGNSLDGLRRYDEALAHYDKALSLKPDFAEAWASKGATLKDLKRYDEALAHYDKALSLKPDFGEAWASKGATLKDLKRYDEALAHYDKALSLKPDFAEAWSGKGATLNDLKRYDEALAHYDNALSLKPDFAEAWASKGATFNDLKRYDEALAHYDNALSLKPDFAEAWASKGATFNDLKRYDEALAHYDKALSLKPDFAEAWASKGATFNDLKRYDEALAHYDKALSLKPDINWVFGDFLHTKMKICSWSDLSESLVNISKKVLANEMVTSPFPLLALSDETFLHKKSSEIYAQSKYPFNPVLGSILKFSGSQKIRVGYFSSDFKNHAVSILTAELFELHDKDRFEIIAFSFGPDDKSSMRLRLSQTFNQFIDVSDMSDLHIAKLSRELHVDIAVDLGGYTAGARTGIFAYRAAPIQVGYLGYLGTMGVEYFDYLLADNIIIPASQRQFYKEKISYLPTYQVNDRKRVISDKQFTRQELGIPENAFVFCCFNNNYKILPATFDGWMRILKAVDGSILFLYAENQWAESNLIKEAEARGINSSRLVFSGLIPNDEYLARYKVCNLFLDTFPYNAGTTASDALWAGLPVLTLKGKSFASRMAASILNAICLPELITGTQEEYEALAIELAMNPKKLAEVKYKLELNRLTTRLFDTPGFAKNLEAAYIRMYIESSESF